MTFFITIFFKQNRLPFEQVCNMVLDQWLMCDLKDIGAHSLPLNISNSPKYILQGVFVFQVLYYYAFLTTRMIAYIFLSIAFQLSH